MSVSELQGKKLAILLWYVNEGWDSSAALINGVLENRNGILLLIRDQNLPPVNIPWKMVPAIQAVSADVQDIFGSAGFWLEMTIQDLQAA